MKEEPPLEARCRDKFLVQSVAITADREITNITAIVRDPKYGQEQFTHTSLVGEYRTDRKRKHTGEEDPSQLPPGRRLGSSRLCLNPISITPTRRSCRV